MKALIIIFIVWIIIAVIVFLIQMFFNIGEDRDQTITPWGEMIKQSILWPLVLIKIVIGR